MRRSSLLRRVFPAALLLAASARGQAQGAAGYTLVIARAGAEIGREQIVTRPEARGLPGSTISGVARYPGTRPRVQLSVLLERGPTGTLSTAQFDVQTPEHAWRTYAAATQGRLTVRSATQGRESAREYPAGPRTVVLDDSVYAPWIAVAQFATDEGAVLHAIWPRTGRRGTITARRVATTSPGRAVEVTGADTLRIELASDDQLLRIILPGRDIVVSPGPQ